MEGVTDSMKITNYTQEFITDDNKPFDSAHASTLLELKDGGILAAWFALLVTAWVVLAVFPIALAAGSIGSLIGGIGYFSIYYPIGLQGIGWALAGGGLTMLCWKPCLLAIIGLWNVHKLLWQKFCRWMKKEVAYETVQ